MNSLSIECHLAFLEAAYYHVQEKRDEWADENYEIGNYVLEYIQDFVHDATDDISEDLFCDKDLDGYHELWMDYVKKFKEIESKHTPTRDNSIYTMFDRNLWSGSVEEFKERIVDSADEFSYLNLMFKNSEGDFVDCPRFDSDIFVTYYYRNVDDIWRTNCQTSHVDMNAMCAETGLTPLDHVITQYVARETINEFLDVLSQDIENIKSELV